MITRRDYKGKTMDFYAVFGKEVREMTDQEIISACDKGNFGGKVVRFSNTEARVHVYKD